MFSFCYFIDTYPGVSLNGCTERVVCALKVYNNAQREPTQVDISMSRSFGSRGSLYVVNI